MARVYEKEMEDWLYQRPELFHLERWAARQFGVFNDRLDLLGEYPDGSLLVVEVKEVASTKPEKNMVIAQACHYADLIDTALKMRGDARIIRKAVVTNGGGYPNRLVSMARAAGVDLYTLDTAAPEWKLTRNKDYTSHGLNEWGHLADRLENALYGDVPVVDLVSVVRKAQAEERERIAALLEPRPVGEEG